MIPALTVIVIISMLTTLLVIISLMVKDKVTFTIKQIIIWGLAIGVGNIIGLWVYQNNHQSDIITLSLKDCSITDNQNASQLVINCKQIR